MCYEKRDTRLARECFVRDQGGKMDQYTATELAYKNGYEQGKKDAATTKELEALKRENADLKLMLDGMALDDKYRETPMTIVRKQYHDGWYHRFYCPVCGKGQKLSKTAIEKWYCERCGQALTTKDGGNEDG